MPFLKFILKALLGLMMVVCLAIIICIFLPDRAYLKLLTTGVQQFSNYRLSVSGNFQISRSTSPTIYLSGVKLKDTINGDDITLNNFYLNFDLSDLFFGTLLVKKWIINDLLIDLKGVSKPDTEYDLSFVKYLPVPVLEDVLLDNIVLHDRNRQLHKLYQLQISANDKFTPIKFTAMGEVLNQPYSITGEFGTITEILDSSSAFPITLQGKWLQNSLNISGDIKDMAQLKGLDLVVDIHIPDLQQLFQTQAVEQVALKLQAQLQGELDLPVLSDIELLIDKGSTIKMLATGHVDDLLTLNGTQLEVSGYVKDQQLLAEWMPDNSPVFEQLYFNANVLGRHDDVFLEDLDVALTIETGFMLALKGSMQIEETDHWFKNIKLSALMNSPDTATINPMLGGFLPEMGASKGQAEVHGTADGLLIDAITLVVGQGRDSRLSATGSIEIKHIIKADSSIIPNLKLALQSKKSTQLTELFNIKHPEIGAVSGQAHLINKAGKVSLQNLKIQAGSPRIVEYVVQGIIDWDKKTDYQQYSDLRITARSHSIKKMMGGYDINTPDLGQLNAGMRIKGANTQLSGSDLHVAVGSVETLLIQAEGLAEKINIAEWAFSGLDLKAKASANSTQNLAPIFGLQSFPDLGSLTSQFTLQGSLKNLSVPEFDLSVSDHQGLLINIAGDIKQLPMQPQQLLSGMDLDLSADILSIKETGQRLGYKMPDLGVMKMTGQFEDQNGRVNFKQLKMIIGQPQSPELSIKGQVIDVFSQQDRVIKVSINSQSLASKLGANYKGITLAMQGDVHINQQNSDFKGTLSIGETNILSDLQLSTATSRPKITGTLYSPHAQLKDFGLRKYQSSVTPNDTGPNPGVPDIFSDKPLHFELFNQVDLELQIKADVISGIYHQIDRFDSRLLLEQGKLQLKPAKFYLSEGQVELSLAVDATSTRKMQFHAVGQSIKLGQFLAEREAKPAVQGNLDFVVDVLSQGLSESELAENLQGHVGVALENGTIRKRELEVIFLNLVGWLFSYGISDNELSVSCAIANYEINQGLAKTSIFLIDGPKVLVRGDGEINLANGTINYKVNLEKKKIIGNYLVPILITGNLANPLVKQAPLGSVFSKLDRYFVSPVVEVPSELLGSLWDIVDTSSTTNSPCQKLLRH